MVRRSDHFFLFANRNRGIFLFMYCSKCGTENSEDSAFCKKCGKALENDDRLVVKLSEREDIDDEEIAIISIRPTLKFVRIGYVMAVILAFLVVAIIGILSRSWEIPIPAWVSVLIGLSFLLVPAYYHLRQKTVKYELTDSRVIIEDGLISKTTRNVPLGIIQNVTVSRSVLQRMLGFGDIEIENANEQDETILLDNIDSPQHYADKIMREMRKRHK